MHVDPVAYQLGDDVVRFEDRSRESGGAMSERRHAVEEVCRLSRACADPVERLRVRCAGMSKRDVVAVADQRLDQLGPSVELGGDRHDPDVGPRLRNLLKNVVAGPVSSLGVRPGSDPGLTPV